MVFFGQVTRHQIRVEHSRLLVRHACPSVAGWAQKRRSASRWALKSWLRTSQHLSVTKNRQQINRSTLIRLADEMPLLCSIRSMACTPWTAEIGSRMPEVAQYGKVAQKKTAHLVT